MAENRIEIFSHSQQQNEKKTQWFLHIPTELHDETGAFKQQVVSIGLVMSSQPQLKGYESIKKMFVHQRLPYRATRLADLVNHMIDTKVVSRVWELYGNPVRHFSDSRRENLAWIMAYDGIFLLQILREIAPWPDADASVFTNGPVNPDTDVAGFFRPLLLSCAVQNDIMKLGNQIPIFVLQSILQWEADTYQSMMLDWNKSNNTAGMNRQHQISPNTPSQIRPNPDLQMKIRPNPELQMQIRRDMSFQLVAGRDQDLDSILTHACHTLSPFVYTSNREQRYSNVFIGVELKEESHLLGFVYKNIIGSSRSTARKTNNKEISLPGAGELGRKELKFAANRGVLNDISFEPITLTIYLPTIKMNDRTYTVMRNLLALEKYVLKKEKKPICCYVKLMCQLIRKDEDVEVLRNSGIIHSRVGTDQEVARIWSEIEKTLPSDGEFEPINILIDDIKFYTSKCRVMCAEFKKTYFSKPWITVSVIVAFFIFVLTLLQTIFSGEQVHQGSKNDVKTPQK